MRRVFMIILVLLLSSSGARAQGTTALLDTLQHTGFNYFWNEANPGNGLIKDRSTPGSPASIAAVGFGLTSIAIAIDHGWITRSAGTDRVLTTLQTFWNDPQGSGSSGFIGYKGLFYHFLDMTTGLRTWDSELSTIDTGLLFAGILDAKQYFTGSDPRELQIRSLADSIYYRADWNFMRNLNPGILMGWKPGTGFSNFQQWIGYNEAMILYIEALGSPTHAVPASAWTQWTSGYSWKTYTFFGQPNSFVTCPPLFTHQYSHCWVDFRYMQDAYMRLHNSDYFENSRRASLVQHSYCKLNPTLRAGYSDSLWGITASDGPPNLGGYNARGFPPLQNEDGTIAPTAAGGSIAFAPEIAIPCLRNMWNNYPLLRGTYGLKDAFNLAPPNPPNPPLPPWYDTDFLGIDEGPIVIMIENYRTGSVWHRFMQNADIRNGLTAAEFYGTVGSVPGSSEAAAPAVLFQNSPNPFRGSSTLRYSLAREGHVRLRVFDMRGCQVRLLVDRREAAGPHVVALRGEHLPSGVYQYRLEAGSTSLTKKCVLIQ